MERAYSAANPRSGLDEGASITLALSPPDLPKQPRQEKWRSLKERPMDFQETVICMTHLPHHASSRPDLQERFCRGFTNIPLPPCPPGHQKDDGSSGQPIACGISRRKTLIPELESQQPHRRKICHFSYAVALHWNQKQKSIRNEPRPASWLFCAWALCLAHAIA
jgi:hypothetical protein